MSKPDMSDVGNIEKVENGEALPVEMPEIKDTDSDEVQAELNAPKQEMEAGTYITLGRLKYNGDVYEKGDKVKLDAETATLLVSQKVVTK